MADASFTIKGERELIKALKTLDDRLGRRVIAQALIASAKPITKGMKGNLKQHRRTGTLQKAVKALRVDKLLRGKEVVVFVGAHKARSIDFARDGFYGRFLESGTSRQPPRPWARPALDANRAEQQKILALEMGRRIVKEVKRSARKIIGF